MNFVRKMYTQRAVSTPTFPLALRNQEASRIINDASSDFPSLSDIDNISNFTSGAVDSPRKSPECEMHCDDRDFTEDGHAEVLTPKIERKQELSESPRSGSRVSNKSLKRSSKKKKRRRKGSKGSSSLSLKHENAKE